jgi:hypothetical protein
VINDTTIATVVAVGPEDQKDFNSLMPTQWSENSDFSDIQSLIIDNNGFENGGFPCLYRDMIFYLIQK